MFRSSRNLQQRSQAGFTLFELILTLTVLAVMVAATVPLMQNTAKRQKEQRLRESLRLMRQAIDEFKRDTLGACPTGARQTSNPAAAAGSPAAPTDPRSRVVIEDCTIFTTENIDRYPPTLETLAVGVKVKERMPNMTGGSGLRDGERQATEMNQIEEILKYYLREVPVDPMTGKADWKLRSSYQDKDSDSWDSINVFDVRSSSDEEGLNGEKYSEW